MSTPPPVAQAATALTGRATQSSLVYDCLRADILQGLLEPGRRLRIDEICARYGVSATPLREALSRLSAEGLVSRSDQRGFGVAPLRWDELPALIRSRQQIESIALRESIAQRDAAWEDQLALLLHRLTRTARSLSTEGLSANPQWETLHTAFHASLLSRCPSRWMREFADELSQAFLRFRVMAARQSYGRRDPHAEHVAIFHAAIDGRADEAVALLDEHYSHTSALVLALARQQQDRTAS